MPRARKPIPLYLENPFKIVVDCNETLSYSFQGIARRHSSGQKLPLVVETVRKTLWNMDAREIEIVKGKKSEWHKVGYADYSIDGLEKYIQVERKSLSDAFSTIGGRHSRFEAEIKRLHEDCLVAAVVIEAGLPEISVFNTEASSCQVRDEPIQQVQPIIDLLSDEWKPSPVLTAMTPAAISEDDLSFDVDARLRFGKTSPAVVLGTISRWSQRYRNVHWYWCGNRSMAEMWTFKVLSDFWDLWVEGHFEERVKDANRST